GGGGGGGGGGQGGGGGAGVGGRGPRPPRRGGAAGGAGAGPGAAPRRTSDPDPSAEEALRPPEEHRDHDQKGDGVLVGVGHVAAGQRLRETDQKAGRDRSVDVAEAARHHRRERLEGQRGAHIGEDVEERRDERGRERGQGR